MVKKTILLILCVCLAVSFFGCLRTPAGPIREAIAFAQGNAELLRAGAQAMIDIMQEKRLALEDKSNLYYIVKQSPKGALQLTGSNIKAKESVQNEPLQKLFDSNFIDCISLHSRGDRIVVVFSCGGYGIGSATGYYNIQYLPSGNVSDLWDYDKKMTFTELEEGCYGTKPESDNTFFYRQLDEDLFYCEAFY